MNKDDIIMATPVVPHSPICGVSRNGGTVKREKVSGTSKPCPVARPQHFKKRHHPFDPGRPVAKHPLRLRKDGKSAN